MTPRLHTPRTILRGWREADLDAYAAICADAEVMRFLGGVADREQAWRAMALYAGHWALKGYGLWAVQRRADGRLIGRVGLWQPEGWPGLEIGWKLARSAWGQGYAQESARAAMEWAWSALDAPELISLIDGRNRASIRVALRLGMGRSGGHLLGGQPVSVFALQRPQGGTTSHAGP